MKTTVLALALCLLATSVLAHDFWIEPSNYRPRAGEFVRVRLRVGQHFLGDPTPRRAEADLKRFDVLTSEGTAPVLGNEGRDPAGVFRVEDPGMMVVAYYAAPTFVEVPPEKLNTYLSDEGLERVAASWMKSFAGKKPWRENFARCAKSILRSDDAASDLYKKPLGLPLELIPEKDPSIMAGKGTLPVRLLYKGKPLAGTLVVAIPKLDPEKQIAIRSDKKGRVSFKLPHDGQWLIKAVHLFPAQTAGQAEWESLWASVTFEVPAAK